MADAKPKSPEGEKNASSVKSQPFAKRKSDQADIPVPPKKTFTCNLKSKASNSPSLGLKTSSKPVAPIKMSLGVQKTKDASTKKSTAVSSVFGQDDSDEEEMPPEAKMRMRNIGRDTPTAAGPNSFGKDRLGFCDRQRLLEKQLQDEMDKISNAENS